MFEKPYNIPKNLSPNLFPTRREALIPHSLVGKGARGLGLSDFESKIILPDTSSKAKGIYNC
jgi:hypothetical protein